MGCGRGNSCLCVTYECKVKNEPSYTTLQFKNICLLMKIFALNAIQLKLILNVYGENLPKEGKK